MSVTDGKKPCEAWSWHPEGETPELVWADTYYSELRVPEVLGTTFMQFPLVPVGLFNIGDGSPPVYVVPLPLTPGQKGWALLCRSIGKTGDIWRKDPELKTWKQKVIKAIENNSGQKFREFLDAGKEVMKALFELRGSGELPNLQTMEKKLDPKQNQNVDQRKLQLWNANLFDGVNEAGVVIPKYIGVSIPRVGPDDLYTIHKMKDEEQLVIDETGLYYGKWSDFGKSKRDRAAKINSKQKEKTSKGVFPFVALSFIVLEYENGEEGDDGMSVIFKQYKTPAGPYPGEDPRESIWERISSLLKQAGTSLSNETLKKEIGRREMWKYFVTIDRDFLLDPMNQFTLVKDGTDLHRNIAFIAGGVSGFSTRTSGGTVATYAPGSGKISPYVSYGCMHRLYLLTVVGQARMVELYLSPKCEFPTCPYEECKGTRMFPIGMSDELKSTGNGEGVKFYCPRCGEVYNPVDPKDSMIDGAFFGPSYVHLLLQRYPDLLKISE